MRQKQRRSGGPGSIPIARCIYCGSQYQRTKERLESIARNVANNHFSSMCKSKRSSQKDSVRHSSYSGCERGTSLQRNYQFFVQVLSSPGYSSKTNTSAHKAGCWVRLGRFPTGSIGHTETNDNRCPYPEVLPVRRAPDTPDNVIHQRKY